MTWDYRCPECGARIVSGWADPICPVPTCEAVLDVVSAPEPSEQDASRMIQAAEALLRRTA
ncbi:MAG: hypothetical protein IT175_06285 [Acidobacteria bacterium]|nr:hypothetical protein [Acidobacteriota bacterium]